MINLAIGSITQFLTAANGMPDNITRRLMKLQQQFLNASVNKDTMEADITIGGKRMFNLQSRNDAIKLMQLKRYLELDPTLRPIWPYLADIILAKHSAASCKVPEAAKVNTYLQTWKPSTKQLPKVLVDMIRTAKKYAINFHSLKPSQTVQLEMPLWYHLGADRNKLQMNNSKRSRCLRATHNVQVVGDAIQMLKRLEVEDHVPLRGCTCTSCKHDRDQRCDNPHACISAVANRLNQLLPSWNPTIPQPELNVLDHIDAEEGDVVFDPKLETKFLSSGFRIFTNREWGQRSIPETQTVHPELENLITDIWCTGYCLKPSNR